MIIQEEDLVPPPTEAFVWVEGRFVSGAGEAREVGEAQRASDV